METRTCKEGNDIIWFMVFKVRSGCSVESRFRSVSMQQRPVSYGCGPGKWKQSLDPEQWLWTWGDMGRLLYLFWVRGHARELDVGHKWKQMQSLDLDHGATTWMDICICNFMNNVVRVCGEKSQGSKRWVREKGSKINQETAEKVSGSIICYLTCVTMRLRQSQAAQVWDVLLQSSIVCEHRMTWSSYQGRSMLIGEWQRVGNIWTYVIRVARCRIYTKSEKNGRILQKLVGNLSRTVEQNGPSSMETTTLARKPSVRNNFRSLSIDTK